MSLITRRVELQDIMSFQNGRAFKKSEWSDTGLPIIRIQNLNKSEAPFNYFTGDYDDRIEVRSGDLLFSWSGTIGSSFGPHIWSRETGVLNQHIFKVSLSDNIDKKYAYYALLEITAEVEKQVAGAVGLVHISRTKLDKFKIPLPPLSEQHRIVAILDEVFEGIVTATANAEKNLANARELFESYLNSVFNEKGEEWVELDELAIDITDGDHSAPPKSTSGIPFITISDINKETNKIDFTETFKVPRNYYKALKSKRQPKAGDVLYTVTGSFGIPVLVDSDIEFCFQRHIGLIRPNNQTHSKWLFYLFMSPMLFKQADQSATGAAQRTVGLKSLRSFRVPKVSLRKQEETVTKLDAQYTAIRRLETIYKQKLNDLTELKQSILQKAFSGELTQKAA